MADVDIPLTKKGWPDRRTREWRAYARRMSAVLEMLRGIKPVTIEQCSDYAWTDE